MSGNVKRRTYVKKRQKKTYEEFTNDNIHFIFKRYYKYRRNACRLTLIFVRNYYLHS